VISRRLVLSLWVLLIFAVVLVSVLPGSVAPRQPVGGGVEHCLAYFPLALIPAAAWLRARNGITAASLMILLGVILELVQTQIPDRSFDWRDIAANTLGVMAGAALGLPLRNAVARRLTG